MDLSGRLSCVQRDVDLRLGGRSLDLLVRQTQVDTATADSTGLRFETPLAFRAPVAIRIGTAGGDTVVRAVIDRREQTIRIEG